MMSFRRTMKAPRPNHPAQRTKHHQKHNLCLKHIPKSSIDVKKLENRSAIALHSIESGHIVDFNGTRIIQKGFNSYKERLTAEALHIWADSNNINRRDGIQLAVPRQLIINK
ncbi:unnamed protein product [Schistosoma curassoni]|nr:unnamed protein product [Schistosoma curassoni]